MTSRGCDRGARRCRVARGQSTMMVAQKQPNHIIHMLVYTLRFALETLAC